MLRSAIGGLPLMLAACATAPAGTPVHGVTPGHKCRADATAQFVGQLATIQTGTEIMRASNAAVLRWARMGMMLTMDYREDRVTVRLGPDQRILSVNCG